MSQNNKITCYFGMLNIVTLKYEGQKTEEEINN